MLLTLRLTLVRAVIVGAALASALAGVAVSAPSARAARPVLAAQHGLAHGHRGKPAPQHQPRHGSRPHGHTTTHPAKKHQHDAAHAAKKREHDAAHAAKKREHDAAHAAKKREHEAAHAARRHGHPATHGTKPAPAAGRVPTRQPRPVRHPVAAKTRPAARPAAASHPSAVRAGTRPIFVHTARRRPVHSTAAAARTVSATRTRAAAVHPRRHSVGTSSRAVAATSSDALPRLSAPVAPVAQPLRRLGRGITRLTGWSVFSGPVGWELTGLMLLALGMVGAAFVIGRRRRGAPDPAAA